MDIRFDVVKKLTKPLPRAKGITLRSIRAEEGGTCASAILMAGGYQQIRESVEQYRMMTGRPLSCRAKGKSLEVVSEGGEDPLDVLMDFLSSVSFNSEDVMETLEFYLLYLRRDCGSGMRPLALEQTSEDLRIACCASAQDGETAETVYAAVSSLLDHYDMGIIKEEGVLSADPEEN